MAKLLEGKVVADKIITNLRTQIKSLKSAPVLASIMIGEDSGTLAYAKVQARIAQELGIIYQLHQLPPDISEDKLVDFLLKLNADPLVNGIILQSPLPKQIDYMKVCELIQPSKDVEGMHPSNIGKLMFAKARIAACTANAVMELLNSIEMDLYGKEVVIVGHSEIVGKPLAMLLLEKFATVTICHIATSKAGKLQEHVKRAEVLIVAVGQANLVKGDWIREGAVVIDVGINRLNDKIIGDVEFESAAKRAAYITPVPGGVGPLTVAILMRNLVEAAKAQQS